MGRSRSRSRSRSRGRRYRSPSGSRSRSRSFSPDGYRVHVADIGLDPSKREIEKHFEKYGPLIEVWVARNPPCFAFVVYKYKDDAEAAIRELDGKLLSNGRIRVSFARPRTKDRGRRKGFDPNLRCYQCGERGHFSRDCDEIWRQRQRNRERSYSYRSRESRRSRSRTRSRSRSRDRRRRSRDSRSRSRSKQRRKSQKSSSKSPRQGREPKDPSKSPSPDRERETRKRSGSGRQSESERSPAQKGDENEQDN